MSEKSIVKRPTDRLKEICNSPTVLEQFKNALGENSGLFVASLIDLYGSDKYLQECDPGKVVMEALKAATLKLPINKSLGFAYVISYKKVPQFQIGYKGLLQLAIRSGQYKRINADVVLEGELIKANKLTGEIEMGEPTGTEVVGYFGFIETINGFQKALYWPKERVLTHAKRFSQSYSSSHSPWKTDFDSMAIKTVLKQLIGKYGIMSVEMVSGFDSDNDEDRAQREVNENANSDFIDIDPSPQGGDTGEMTPEEVAEIQARELAEAEAAEAEGPGF